MAPLRPHHLQWVTASPLWNTASKEPVRMRAPQLLRFESDRFMEELAARLQALPRPDLSGLVASPLPANTPLKLFQPAHGHFYLVAANLVCRLAGLPDHIVDAAGGERVAFVLRRLEAEGSEQAWVPDPEDATRQRHLWASLPRGEEQRLARDEELFPMFPVNFTVEERRRRLLVGFIPTSSRETFQSATAFAAANAEGHPLVLKAEERVVDPYAYLKSIPSDAAESEPEKDTSRFLLLDLATLLQEDLPSLWSALEKGVAPASTTKTRALYDTLHSHRVGSGGTEPTWREALVEAWTAREHISAGEPSTVNVNLRRSPLPVDTLRSNLTEAMKSSTLPTPQPSGQVPKLERPGEARYILRCAYVRPHCGALQPPLVSEPTAAFTLAAFFDPDAPARPVHITLPADTSIAGLRKYKKNVSFVLSNKLREQMSRVGELKGLMDKKLPGGTSFNLGEICSFSIPIITICAFIVLMIFLILLNIIFWWLPFLKICLPTVKAK
ncbi:hypothetical protein ATI61_11383 [Archangium gephyra]|uniref:Uncharacterized protein n=1 Tax=Archangium gephyra TaxID=48 RepID=A0AAC8Q8U6_9BACT|nr:hypothetical protein [Archangium gephyra]AKJ02894.1 Hypothetical protein AA314_04520 [Archangium gephyra]REG25020.1 hypothetical protein ATI61_11383 [Archangium gephyra]